MLINTRIVDNARKDYQWVHKYDFPRITASQLVLETREQGTVASNKAIIKRLKKTSYDKTSLKVKLYNWFIRTYEDLFKM